MDDHQEPAVAGGTNIYHSKVDTSRPFRSVKEAVAIFGERFLAGEIYAPTKKPFSFPNQETPCCFYTPSPSPQMYSQELTSSWRSTDHDDDDPISINLAETLKKLEAELEDTKQELKKLKERESETEVALASLNAELHKNVSKLAQAEAQAAAAAKAFTISRSAAPERNRGSTDRDGILNISEEREEGLENSHSLAQILLSSSTAADREGWFEANFIKKEKRVKKKPIIPLVGELFSRKKGSSTSVLNPLYASYSSHLRSN